MENEICIESKVCPFCNEEGAEMEVSEFDKISMPEGMEENTHVHEECFRISEEITNILVLADC